MSRYHSYLNSAKQILSIYNGNEPFASFLKKYFSEHKKYGSKDRKQIGHLCYCYFRTGKSLPNLTVEEKIVAGQFLCSTKPNEILSALKPEWNGKADLSIAEKFSILNSQVSSVFPWKDQLSNGIDHGKFCESFFQQPDLFLRLRPGKEKIVQEKLQRASIDFKTVLDSCIALDNSTKIDSIIELDKEAVVQDLSSQQTGNYIKLAMGNLQLPINTWDCCAGSGGKSIMLYDLDPKIKLTVSDVRESILANLKKRFESAGINNYKSLILDLTKSSKQNIGNFDLIIADVPCTGSGTWSRTPEQLFYFDDQSIEQFSNLQKKIVSNVIPHLQASGYFLYITCSVFKKENEEVVEFIKEKFNLESIKNEVLKGYDKKADTMFAALLKKNL